MHSNALIYHTVSGRRFTQCPKCQERYELQNPGFVHGSHLCCKGCGENLLLQELTMGELENFTQPVTFVQGSHNIETGEVIEPLHKRVGKIDRIKLTMTSERDSTEAGKAQVIAHSLRAVGALYNVPVSRLLGCATTAEAEKECRSYYDLLAMDASQRNEKLKQELIRQYTNAATFKLGRISKRMQQRDQTHANSRKKEIKDQLAQNLKLIGCTYTEIGEIISELVKGLKSCNE